MGRLAGGESEAEIARRYGVSREAVRKWKNAYLENRLEPLDIGRRPRARLRDVAPLIARAARSPARYGLPPRWSAADLRSFLAKRAGVRYSYPRTYAILRQLGYVFDVDDGWTRHDPAGRRAKKKKELPWGYCYDAAGKVAREPREHRVVCVARHMHVASGSSAKEIAGVLKKMGVRGRDGKALGVRDVARMLNAR